MKKIEVGKIREAFEFRFKLLIKYHHLYKIKSITNNISILLGFS